MPKVPVTCQECRKEFLVYESIIKMGFGKFCSFTCKGKWQSKTFVGEKSPRWMGGDVINKCSYLFFLYFPIIPINAGEAITF
jgi:hypothetical protein